MTTPRSEDPESTEPTHGDQLWPMGAVSRRTGITEHTLRAWERRFGFPRPVRLPSGHRRYTSEQVRHLLLITLALDQGCRAGDVVPMPLDRLEALLREAGALDAPTEAAPAERWLESLMDGVRRFDTAAVSGLLQRDAGLLGLPRFLRERVVPLITELGEGGRRAASTCATSTSRPSSSRPAFAPCEHPTRRPPRARRCSWPPCPARSTSSASSWSRWRP